MEDDFNVLFPETINFTTSYLYTTSSYRYGGGRRGLIIISISGTKNKQIAFILEKYWSRSL